LPAYIIILLDRLCSVNNKSVTTDALIRLMDRFKRGSIMSSSSKYIYRVLQLHYSGLSL